MKKIKNGILLLFVIFAFVIGIIFALDKLDDSSYYNYGDTGYTMEAGISPLSASRWNGIISKINEIIDSLKGLAFKESIGSSDITDNTVTYEDIKDGTIRTEEIKDNTIGEDDISDDFKARDSEKADGLKYRHFNIMNWKRYTDYWDVGDIKDWVEDEAEVSNSSKLDGKRPRSSTSSWINSDDYIPTSKAVQSYIEAKINSAIDTKIASCDVCVGWVDSRGTSPSKTKCVPMGQARSNSNYIRLGGDVNGDDALWVRIDCN